MDKHYGWQEGRGAQGQGRPQNGQRWNERYRDDDRDMRGARGGEYGGGPDQDERRWSSSGADLDREDYVSEDEEYGAQSRGGFASRGPQQGRWSQGGSSNRTQFGGGRGTQGFGGQTSGGQGFSGGHYGGFANEGFSGQGNYGGNRGFSNQGYSGPRYNQGSSGQGRGYSSQGTWNQGSQGTWNQGGGQNWGQTFGQGYSGSEYGSRGQSYGGYQQGRGFAGRGPKGYQRSDERVKEQLSDRLMDDDDVDASEISIEVKNGEVTLTGTVNSREEKRAAEEIAEQSPGVREVQNLLRVSQSAPSAQSGRSVPAQSKSRSSERE